MSLNLKTHIESVINFVCLSFFVTVCPEWTLAEESEEKVKKNTELTGSKFTTNGDRSRINEMTTILYDFWTSSTLYWLNLSPLQGITPNKHDSSSYSNGLTLKAGSGVPPSRGKKEHQ